MKTCPKCGYTRQPEDAAPEYECPRCGIVYAKYKPRPAPKVAAPRVAPVAPPGAPAVSPRELVCRACGALGQTRIHTPGSIWIELLAWAFLLLPGMIYSAWRHTRRGTVCACCDSADLVQVGLPVGQRLLAEFRPGAVVQEGGALSARRAGIADRFFKGLVWTLAGLFAVGLLLGLLAAATR